MTVGSVTIDDDAALVMCFGDDGLFGGYDILGFASVSGAFEAAGIEG